MIAQAPAPFDQQPAGQSRPLAVDLDGTLIKTDLLLESANWLVARHPFRLLQMFSWLRRGRAVLKAELARVYPLDAAALPYHEGLLQWLAEQKRAGRHLVLATASHRLLAEQVAQHTGLFDEVLASDGDLNLKSVAKRDALTERFGAGGFDYVGNDHADVPVWQAAAEAHAVAPTAGVRQKFTALAKPGQVFPHAGKSPASALRRALRPHQWVKNLLLFVPILAAHHFDAFNELAASLQAFVAFCLMASSLYLLNDLIDVNDDRHHQSKRTRPFAAGDLSLLAGWLLWPVMALVACILAWWALPPHFLLALASYAILTFSYSLYLKRVAMLDVVTLAALYTLRVVAGGFAAGVPLSFWLLSFSMFMFLSLAFIKRFCELKPALERERTGRLRGRGYFPEDLEMVSSMGTSAGYLAVLVLAMYIQDPHTTELYRTPKFIWLACPLLLYWISRTWLIAHRGQMHDDPVVFALKDKVSWLVAAAFVGVFALARVVG